MAPLSYVSSTMWWTKLPSIRWSLPEKVTALSQQFASSLRRTVCPTPSMRTAGWYVECHRP